MATRKRFVKIGIVQTAVGNDRESHLDKTSRMIGKAARQGAGIVCLQELFADRYFAQTEDPALRALAEPIPGPLSRFLSAEARRHRITLVGGSIYERGDDGNLYNTTLVHDPRGACTGKYRKTHIPQDPLYHEQFYFAPGNLGYIQVPAASVRIAPLICYDQWFPEAARINVLHGAQILVYPTAIGWIPGLRQAEPFSAKRWEAVMRSHASANGVYVVAVNRVGREGQMRFWGGSFVADPFGEVVAKASASREQVLVTRIDLDRIAESQDGWRFLHNRRPETYGDLLK